LRAGVATEIADLIAAAIFSEALVSAEAAVWVYISPCMASASA
jgi:hypothetical protein